ncbi:hypothetical protein Gotur_019522 [Gossypium turneri]
MKKLDTEIEQYNYRAFPDEFIWELNDETPEGHLPLTNALRGTQLFNSILSHPAFEGQEEEAETGENGGVTVVKPVLPAIDLDGAACHRCDPLITSLKIEMRFDRNVSVGDMKKLNEKISRLIELLDDDDIETMVALYCPPGRENTESIQFFTELTDVEPVENVTQLSQQYGVENLRTKVPKASIDRRLSVLGLTSILTLDVQISTVVDYIYIQFVIETDVFGEDGSDNNDCSGHECEDFSGPVLDDVPDDINDEGANDGNDHAPSVENSSRGIVIRNDLRAHMSIVDPDAAHAFEFPEYLDIIPAHLMLENPEPKVLFMGQRFVSKDECVDAIKRYSVKKGASGGYELYLSKGPSSVRYGNMLGLIHAFLDV